MVCTSVTVLEDSATCFFIFYLTIHQAFHFNFRLQISPASKLKINSFKTNTYTGDEFTEFVADTQLGILTFLLFRLNEKTHTALARMC